MTEDKTAKVEVQASEAQTAERDDDLIKGDLKKECLWFASNGWGEHKLIAINAANNVIGCINRHFRKSALQRPSVNDDTELLEDCLDVAVATKVYIAQSGLRGSNDDKEVDKFIAKLKERLEK